MRASGRWQVLKRAITCIELFPSHRHLRFVHTIPLVAIDRYILIHIFSRTPDHGRSHGSRTSGKPLIRRWHDGLSSRSIVVPTTPWDLIGLLPIFPRYVWSTSANLGGGLRRTLPGQDARHCFGCKDVTPFFEAIFFPACSQYVAVLPKQHRTSLTYRQDWTTGRRQCPHPNHHSNSAPQHQTHRGLPPLSCASSPKQPSSRFLGEIRPQKRLHACQGYTAAYPTVAQPQRSLASPSTIPPLRSQIRDHIGGIHAPESERFSVRGHFRRTQNLEGTRTTLWTISSQYRGFGMVPSML